MKTFNKPGVVLTVAAPANVSSGDGVLVGSIFGVASGDALSGASVEIVTEGVFDLPKADEEEWTVGARIYWDDTAGNCTTVDATTAATNTLIGVAVAAVSDDAGEVIGRVLLTGAFTQ